MRLSHSCARRGRISYDEVWEAVLPSQLVWESDLKGWIKEWQAQDQLGVQGLGPRERVPKLGKRHMLASKDS